MKLNSLPNEIQELIIEIYINKYIKCYKNKELKNLKVNHKINNLCKKMEKRCNIYLLKDIKLEICGVHDNTDINIVKEIERKIKSLKICNKYTDLKFIHIDNIYKYEFILKKILKEYGYKLKNYCCNKNGCRIKKIQYIYI